MFLPFGYKLMITFSTIKTDRSELRVGWYCETSLSPPVIFLLTVPRRYFFLGSFFYLYNLSLPYCLVCVLQYYGHLLGKGCFLGSPVCGVLLCFCHFPIRCVGQVWYLTESIPELCLLPYFEKCSSDVWC